MASFAGRGFAGVVATDREVDLSNISPPTTINPDGGVISVVRSSSPLRAARKATIVSAAVAYR